MPWFNVDDNFADHPKTVAAGNAAIGLWCRAGSWCNRHLTDGYVPSHMVTALGGTRANAKRLVEVGLWLPVEGGYQFHQWHQNGRNKTREQVESERAAWRKRQAKAREGRKGDYPHAV